RENVCGALNMGHLGAFAGGVAVCLILLGVNRGRLSHVPSQWRRAGWPFLTQRTCQSHRRGTRLQPVNRRFPFAANGLRRRKRERISAGERDVDTLPAEKIATPCNAKCAA